MAFSYEEYLALDRETGFVAGLRVSGYNPLHAFLISLRRQNIRISLWATISAWKRDVEDLGSIVELLTRSSRNVGRAGEYYRGDRWEEMERLILDTAHDKPKNMIYIGTWPSEKAEPHYEEIISTTAAVNPRHIVAALGIWPDDIYEHSKETLVQKLDGTNMFRACRVMSAGRVKRDADLFGMKIAESAHACYRAGEELEDAKYKELKGYLIRGVVTQRNQSQRAAERWNDRRFADLAKGLEEYYNAGRQADNTLPTPELRIWWIMALETEPELMDHLPLSHFEEAREEYQDMPHQERDRFYHWFSGELERYAK